MYVRTYIVLEMVASNRRAQTCKATMVKLLGTHGQGSEAGEVETKESLLMRWIFHKKFLSGGQCEHSSRGPQVKVCDCSEKLKGT